MDTNIRIKIVINCFLLKEILYGQPTQPKWSENLEIAQSNQI